MDYTVTCDGTPVGTAFIAPLAGLAHADLRPLPAYAALRHHALAAGRNLHLRQHWSAVDGDFAEQFARSWGGGRLSIMDATGTEVNVASVVLVEPRPRVIVDARPDMARVEAFLRTVESDGGGRARPAA